LAVMKFRNKISVNSISLLPKCFKRPGRNMLRTRRPEPHWCNDVSEFKYEYVKYLDTRQQR